MSKFVTVLIVVFLVACIVVLGICVAFMFNEGQNPFKQANIDNDLSEKKSALIYSDSIASTAVTVGSNIPDWGSFVEVSSTSSTNMANFPIALYSRTGDVFGYIDYSAKVINFTNSGYNSSPYTTNTILLVDDLNNLSFPVLTSAGTTFKIDGDDFVKTTFVDASTESFSLSFSSLDITKNYYALYIGHQIVGYGYNNSFYVNIFGVVSMSMVEVPDSPTKTGYTFTGWYTDEDCTQLYDEDYVSSDVTLYAGWRANKYTVVFNPNGVSGNVVQQSFTYDAPQNLQQVSFDTDHYKLLGWATSEDGNVVYSLGQSVTNLTAVDGATVQLYAVWERVQFTVTFMVDGEIYSVVSVPSGTALADIINGNVNSVLFFVDSKEIDSLPYEVSKDMSVTLQKTFWGNIVFQDWFYPVVIGVGVLFVVGIIAGLIHKRKGGV